MTSPAPRLSFKPLLDLVGSMTALARRLEMEDNSPLYRDQRAGGFTPAMAERHALKLGYHPALIWGDDWWDLPDGTFGPVDLEESRRREHEAKARARQRAAASRARRHQDGLTAAG